MANLGISEFTFGYAFLFEQTRKSWGKVKSIPIFPSLIKEKKVGWDVHLPLKGKDFYYQFKLSEFLSRRNSKFIKDGTYSSPYYRIKLHRMYFNLQHRMLRKLSQINGDTYYVSPECTDIKVFNQAFLNGQVTNYSRLIPLKNCDPYDADDKKQHYITYQQGDLGFHQHSDKSERKKSVLGEDLQSLQEESKINWKSINDNFANGVLNNSLQVLKEFEGNGAIPYDSEELKEHKLETIDDKLSFSANILWVTLGIAMIIVVENNLEEGFVNGE
jgi:hypothetical protein